MSDCTNPDQEQRVYPVVGCAGCVLERAENERLMGLLVEAQADLNAAQAEAARLGQMVADLKRGVAVAQVIATCDVLRAENLRLSAALAQRDRALRIAISEVDQADAALAAAEVTPDAP